MIPKLFIGGSSQTKSVDGSRIQLTNGYLIFKQTVNQTKRDEEESFMRAATAYFKSFKINNTQLAMLGGHLTKMFSLLEDHIDILYQRTCERRVQIHKLQKWILETFPHSSINLISGIEEEVIVPAGEALLVKSCKKIENLTLIFNRSIGNICYTEFPIDDNSSRFLRLPDHRIVTEGTQIDCNIKRPVFIKRGQEMLVVFENGSLCEGIDPLQVAVFMDASIWRWHFTLLYHHGPKMPRRGDPLLTPIFIWGIRMLKK